VVEEPESEQLERSIPPDRVLASSELTLAEVPRALRRIARGSGDDRLDRLTAAVLGRLALVPLTRGILLEAGAFEEPFLRTLDAIHISSAARLGSALETFVSYDSRQIEAATRARLPVSNPGGN
jgi:predicted nucleic acid-binding protein